MGKRLYGLFQKFESGLMLRLWRGRGRGMEGGKGKGGKGEGGKGNDMGRFDYMFVMF